MNRMTRTLLRSQTDKVLKNLNLKPKSILATIYGDMLVPYGGTVWLGSLVKAAKCFGINEALARTSTLRLSYDGWLHPTKVGKYSYYSMTPEHTKRILNYYPKIYSVPHKNGGYSWYLLLTAATELDKDDYARLRQELMWLGAGQLAPQVFVMTSQLAEIESILGAQNLLNRIQVMEATPVLPSDPELLRVLASKAWNIDALAGSYKQFLNCFRPVWQVLERGKTDIDPETAFILRTLLITEYRRLVIRDPALPNELLPQPWSGHSAFALCKSIYQKVLEPSELFLHEVIQTADGALPDTPDEVYQRFGGLSK